MAKRSKSPRAVEIRSYQVGFGDCFLVSFVYGDRDKRHVLIDFGTTGLVPKRHARAGTAPGPKKKADPATKPSVHMPKVAEEVRKLCADTTPDGRLTAVVATHRHADHVSGFATDGKSGGSGKVIAALAPKVVIQPWTEDPAAAPKAASATPDASGPKRFVAGLAAMQAVAADVARLVESGGARRFSATVQRQLAFLGMDNISNRSAVDNLREMGRASRPVFARYGDDVGLSRLLPGVKVTVLGPPDLGQTKGISKMRSKDRDEFWHLMGASPTTGRAAMRAGGRQGGGAVVPPAARWFRHRLDRLQGQSLLQIVRSLDKQMNNTSLILLFETKGKRFLFPGDAQLENWNWALHDSPEAAANRARLADVDVYKVGHHGSLNATPRKLLWDGFKKRGKTKGKRMISLLSTLRSMHGDSRSKTEVPRSTLKAALDAETDLCNTEKYEKGTLCSDEPLVIPL